MKKEYIKPSLKVVKMDHMCQILAGSGDPTRDVPWWEGEGGAPRYRGDKGQNGYEDDEEDEEEDW